MDLQPVDMQRLVEYLNECGKSLANIIEEFKEVTGKTTLSNSEMFADIELLIELLKLSGGFPLVSKKVVSIFLKIRRHAIERNESILRAVLGEEWRVESRDFQNLILVRVWVECVAVLFSEISVKSLCESKVLPNGRELNGKNLVLVQTANQKIQTVIDRLDLNSESHSTESDSLLEKK